MQTSNSTGIKSESICMGCKIAIYIRSKISLNEFQISLNEVCYWHAVFRLFCEFSQSKRFPYADADNAFKLVTLIDHIDQQ